MKRKTVTTFKTEKGSAVKRRNITANEWSQRRDRLFVRNQRKQKTLYITRGGTDTPYNKDTALQKNKKEFSLHRNKQSERLLEAAKGLRQHGTRTLRSQTNNLRKVVQACQSHREEIVL